MNNSSYTSRREETHNTKTGRINPMNQLEMHGPPARSSPSPFRKERAGVRVPLTQFRSAVLGATMNRLKMHVPRAVFSLSLPKGEGRGEGSVYSFPDRPFLDRLRAPKEIILNQTYSMKRILSPVRLAAAALAFFGAITTRPAADAPKPIEVQTAMPARGEIHRFITLPGSIRANQQVTIFAKVPGYLKSLAVDKGDRVTAGQALGEIEVPELAAEAVKYRAETKVSETEYTRLDAARKNSPDLVTPQAVDESRGRLEIARANLERIETLLNYSKLLAPFAGIVTMRYVDPGAFIPAATSGSTAQAGAIVTLMDFNTVRAQVGVPELEAAFVRVGQPVRVTTESLPGKAFAGTVSRQSYALDEATRSVLIEADLPNPELTLRPGMYATIKVGVEKHPDTTLIPSAALMTEKSGASVFLVTDGKTKKTSVKTGFNDGAKVEILSGIRLEDRVILLGKQTLADGQPVKVTEAK